MTRPPIIEFRGVHKRHGATTVLKGVDLSIEAGQVAVICGPSGSGKSTLVRLVNRLETPSEGDILIDGASTRDWSPARIRKLRGDIGFVFQQFNLYAHLDAQANITLALTRLHGVGAAEAAARASELLARVGLAGRERAFPAELSGGQQQRVAIARALASRPRILVFDEPTSALDPEAIGEVLTVIQELASSGITLLVVTHEMGFARGIADTVIFLDHGEILQQASPEDFFDRAPHPRARRFLQQILSPLHTAAP